MTEAIRLRRAQAGEADLLTDLAMRSKAHWGYDAAFMAACRAELTMRPAAIAGGEVWIAEIAGRVAGFIEVIPTVPQAELRMIFVEPGMLGLGVGRDLWRLAEDRARLHGAVELGVDSDPNAEGFYRSMGAERIGEVPSGSIPGRMLPRLAKRLA